MFKPGDQVFYVPESDTASNLASRVAGLGAFKLPEAIKADLAAGKSIRLRGIVEVALTDGYRLVLHDSLETIWARAHEVESVDLVTVIGDSENSKSLEEQLAEREAYERDGPPTIESRNTPFARFKARTTFKCDVCRDHYDKGAIGYKPTKTGGWMTTARICLRCVVEERAP